MSLPSGTKPFRVVLLTRTGTASGMAMAHALVSRGVQVAGVLAEKRMSLIQGNKGRLYAMMRALKRHGFLFVLRRVREALVLRLRPERCPTPYGDLPVQIVADHHDAVSRAWLKAMRPDVIVLCNTRKIRPEIYGLAEHGAVNLHASLLPKYAGLDSVFWALFHREQEIGFTIHKVAPDLDAGDILLQKRWPLSELCAGVPDAYKLEAFLREQGCKAMADVIVAWPDHAPRAVAQAHTGNTYFSWPSRRQRRRYARYRDLLSRDSKGLKALHLITRMVRGGAQENTLATVKGLRRRGWNAVLATGPSSGPEGSLEKEILQSGVPVTFWPSLCREPALWSDLRTTIGLARWMRRERFVLVHTHTSKAGALGRIAAVLAGVSVIVHTPHGHVFGGYFSRVKTHAFALLERLLALCSDRLIALTNRERQEHLALGIGKAARFAVIPSGVREEDFMPRPGRGKILREELGIGEHTTIIGTLARLVPVKGVDVLIEAFAELAAQRQDIACMIAGDGPDREHLQGLARQYGVEKRVFFLGYRADAAECLAAMDVFVMASRNEGMGRAIVQAGLMQRPMIASAVSGIQDLIQDGENGILIAPENSQALAAGLRGLLEDPARAAAMGRRAREAFLSHYSESGMIGAIETLYADVLQEKGIPGNWCREARATGKTGNKVGEAAVAARQEV